VRRVVVPTKKKKIVPSGALPHTGMKNVSAVLYASPVYNRAETQFSIWYTYVF